MTTVERAMKENIYFDNASTTWPKPGPVYDAMNATIRDLGASPGRGQYALSWDADRLVGDTRRRLATLFNHTGGAERVVFAHNGTDALNIALFGLICPGDHVVTTRLEHNSVLRPLLHLRDTQHVRLTFISRDREGYLRLEELERALKTKTKAVVVNHASNVLGSVQDLATIGRLTRQAGALFVVDASQTAGMVEIDMEMLDIDVLAFAGHKGLFGPMGIGALVVRAGVDPAPFRHGGTGLDSRSRRQPELFPHRLEAGTLPLPAIAGLGAALKWLEALGREEAGEQASPAPLRDVCRTAVRHIGESHARHRRRLDELGTIDGVTVYGPAPDKTRLSTLSFNVEGIGAELGGGILDADFNICARAGLHCAPLVHEDEGTVPAHGGAIRLAPGLFTSDEDLQQLFQSVAALAEIGRIGRRDARQGGLRYGIT
ncbi:aminotransferase class V-fold PLP-dependent enzyme [Rhizobium laguerreae]|uniref:aminotransferase class V-fold PLP-dependent enzyme n=1 Tax=Rhizobium laguerreae TaxID=1076926 RepID=UPI001C924DC4|nr:aminotransferase class V-fold PLP-dependent enzyme [Rhizobium laguerreae]MBY3203468.1 aminotransferase class V-fold PLP-dependent enzyme [Rhizobium laguerreae]